MYIYWCTSIYIDEMHEAWKNDPKSVHKVSLIKHYIIHEIPWKSWKEHSTYCTYPHSLTVIMHSDIYLIIQSWDAYFKGLASGLPSAAAYTPPPSLGGAAPVAMSGAATSEKELMDHLAVNSLIRAYQVWQMHRSLLKSYLTYMHVVIRHFWFLFFKA